MIIGIVIAAIVVIIVIWLISVYNNLVILKKRAENAWAQIDVQLKRRHDLIPNLVNSVKGYMKFEKETLENVIKARSAAVSADSIGDKIEKEQQLQGALGRLLAVFERYPDLKANQNVQTLMGELSETEDKISYSRQFYNDSVTKFNTKIEIFPNSIVANIFSAKFEALPLFELKDAAQREDPQVDLSI